MDKRSSSFASSTPELLFEEDTPGETASLKAIQTRTDTFYETKPKESCEVRRLAREPDGPFGFELNEPAHAWDTFMREYGLTGIAGKFEAVGMTMPLDVLMDLIPLPSSLSREGSIAGSTHTTNSVIRGSLVSTPGSLMSECSGCDDWSDFRALCKAASLTTVESVSLRAALKRHAHQRARQLKQMKMRKLSFLNERAIHIVSPMWAKQNFDERQFVNVNISLLGSTNAGKSCLIHRLSFDTFDSGQASTVGFDIQTLYVAVDPEQRRYPIARVNLWDTSGQEQFRFSLNSQFFRGKHAFLFVYDVIDECSFGDISDVWHPRMLEFVDCKDVIRVLIGTKTDLLCDQASFTTQDASDIRERAGDLSLSLGIPLFQVSSKTGANLVQMIVHVVKAVLDKHGPRPEDRLRSPTDWVRSFQLASHPDELKKEEMKLKTCCTG